MITLFYFLIVLATPLNFSWLWLLISIMMSILQWYRRPIVEEAIRKAWEQAENNNHLGGPFA